MLLATHATATAAGYCARSRTVLLPPRATAYQLAHERAHEAQHDALTRLWRLHAALETTPLVRPARLLLEAHATWTALVVLHRIGRLDAAAVAEAARGLWSYLAACVAITTPRLLAATGLALVDLCCRQTLQHR